MILLKRQNKLPCPKCGGLGMMHPNHPHAFGVKEYGIVQCRKRKKCGARYDADKYEAWLTKRSISAWENGDSRKVDK